MDYRNQPHAHPFFAADNNNVSSPRHPQQPTRIKSFFRQNQNNPGRKVFLPLLYVSLASVYFYNLLLRDVGSGLHALRDNIDANITRSSAPIWNDKGVTTGSPDAEEEEEEMAGLEPRSLADVTIANAEVTWKRRVDYQNHLRRRAELRKKREQVESYARLMKQNNRSMLEQVQGHVDGDGESDNAAEREIVLSLTMSNNSTEREEYIKKLTNLSSKRIPPSRRNIGPAGRTGGASGGADPGFLPVFLMMALCTIFRLFVSMMIGYTVDGPIDLGADSDPEDADTGNNANAATAEGRSASAGAGGGLSSFMAGFRGGPEAARLRRRARAVRARRQFQRFVDRLNAERTANGERPIGADTLRHLANSRDFDGNDYDRLYSFVEENGPAMGSIFSYIGATEAEIRRCPSRTLEASDELLRPPRRGDERQRQQPQQCSVCLEPYQVGETVRTIPCFHTFHTACIDPWLAQRAECPICKHSAIG